MRSPASEGIRKKDAWHCFEVTLKITNVDGDEFWAEVSCIQYTVPKKTLTVKLHFITVPQSGGWTTVCEQTGTNGRGSTIEESQEACIEKLMRILGKANQNESKTGFADYFTRKKIPVQGKP